MFFPSFFILPDTRCATVYAAPSLKVQLGCALNYQTRYESVGQTNVCSLESPVYERLMFPEPCRHKREICMVLSLLAYQVDQENCLNLSTYKTLGSSGWGSRNEYALLTFKVIQLLSSISSFSHPTDRPKGREQKTVCPSQVTIG